MSGRGKTTPASTGGSFKPGTGRKSRTDTTAATDWYPLPEPARSDRIVFFQQRINTSGARNGSVAAYARLQQHIDRLAPGTLIVPPPGGIVAGELDALVAHGSLVGPAPEVTVVPMGMNACHQNASSFVADRPDEPVTVCHGYALAGGLWREHSWVVNTSTGELIETTAACTAYFGRILEGDELDEFVDANRW